MRRLVVTSLRGILRLAVRPSLSVAAALPLAGSLTLGASCGELLAPTLATEAPFTLHYPAVLAASLVGGTWAGFLALAASAGLGLALHVRVAQGSLATGIGVTAGFLAFTIPLHLVVCALRLSARRCERAATEARRQRAALAAGARTRDDFLAVAGHELNTPLTALQLQLEGLARAVCQRRAGFEDLVEQRLGKGLGHLTRLQALITDMLDASRLLHRGIELAPEPVDFAGVVGRVVSRLAAPAARVGSPIRLVHAGPIHGRFDPRRLEQVATHLVSNAVKYGMGKPVAVELRREGDHALLQVRDGGIGVPAAGAARIFERFERAAPGENYGGLGLGLWVVRQVVECAGGSVQVESAPGAGSTFTVRLPLGPTGERDAGPGQASHAAGEVRS